MGSGSTTVVLGFLGALGAGSRAGCGGGGVSMGAGASNRPPPTQRRMTFSALGSPPLTPRAVPTFCALDSNVGGR